MKKWLAGAGTLTRSESKPASEYRIDYYFASTELSNFGVKLRDGTIELKYRTKTETLALSPKLTGKVEFWRKWSFPVGSADLNQLLVPETCWIETAKFRCCRNFRVEQGGAVEETRAEGQASGRCGFEVTTIRIREQKWASVGFEAFGAEEYLNGILLHAVQFLAQALPEGLDLSLDNSLGYPEWLGRQSPTLNKART